MRIEGRWLLKLGHTNVSPLKHFSFTVKTFYPPSRILVISEEKDSPISKRPFSTMTNYGDIRHHLL